MWLHQTHVRWKERVLRGYVHTIGSYCIAVRIQVLGLYLNWSFTCKESGMDEKIGWMKIQRGNFFIQLREVYNDLLCKGIIRWIATISYKRRDTLGRLLLFCSENNLVKVREIMIDLPHQLLLIDPFFLPQKPQLLSHLLQCMVCFSQKCLQMSDILAWPIQTSESTIWDT